ncbi:MAG TPA: class A beta-lactamase [Longimicrobium sp.]|nr:class A beta-lactamase [Longimicrobium sp.]
MLISVATSLLLAAAAPAQAADTSTAALQREIERIAAASAGTVGVTAIHIETGRRVSLRGGERFPMQSVYKLPIALQILRLADEGRVDLDRRVAVNRAELRPGISTLADDYPNGGTFVLRDLVERMASVSDNTASDVVLRFAGGPAAVTANLRAHGVQGVRVDRPEGRMALDFNGIPHAPGRDQARVVDSLVARLAPAHRRAAMERYLADPRDTSTPDGMAELLVKLQRGRFLRPGPRAELMRILTRTPTGPARLKGRLPAGTAVAHKTGTSATVAGITAVVNDVGIVTLPDGSHAAVAVLVKRSTRGPEAAERAIAAIARAVYDHWSPRAASR